MAWCGTTKRAAKMVTSFLEIALESEVPYSSEYVKSLLVLQNFTIARKKREHSFSMLKAFFIRHSSEYETSDSDRKVNRNI